MQHLRRKRAATSVATIVVLVASACSSGTDEPAGNQEPAACAFVDRSTVTEALGAQVNDPTDAGTPLRDAPDVLGCAYATPTGSALTITFSRTEGDQTPQPAVDQWLQGCSSPTRVDVPGAVGAACADGAFGATGTELFALWDDGALTMRIGLQRDAGPEPEDVSKLEAVARELSSSVTPSGFDRAEGESG